jgi:plastocyanin
MQAQLPRIATLLIVAATAGGCGGGGSNVTGPPPAGGLATVVVTPSAATLFTVEPGNTVMLSVVPKDLNGNTVTGAGAPSFSSDNSAIATVANDGMVTVVAAGTAKITATVTAGSVTKEGFATVTVAVAPTSGAVVAPGLAFSPPTVDVQVGGTVGWTTAAIAHTVTFTTAGAPENMPAFDNASNFRVFPTHGNFPYHCLIHPQMTGLVRVH